MPSQHAVLTWERIFTAHEWGRIGRGVIPRRMEHKWFVFVEGDTAHFHRSWTGFCIYQMQVRPVSQGFAVQGLLVNRDPEQNRCTHDEYDLALLDFLTSNLLLGQWKPFPLPPGLAPAETPGMGLFQHHVAGTGYPEINMHDRSPEESE